MVNWHLQALSPKRAHPEYFAWRQGLCHGGGDK